MSGSGGAGAAATAALSPRARALIAAALAGLVIGFLWGVADVPRYTATATVLVSGAGDAPADGPELAAAAELAGSARVADRAAGRLGGDVAGADLLSEVAATADPGAGAVRIDATAESPDFAAAAANGYAMALADVGGKRYRDGAAASIPGSPSEDRPAWLWSLLGLLAGLLVAVVALAIADRRRRARRPTPEAGRPGLGAPVLARLGDPAGLIAERDGTVVLAGAAGDWSELAARLQLDDPERAPRRLAVLEPVAGGGALAVAIGLAATAGGNGLRAIVVEAGLDEPAIASRTGAAPGPGLSDYLAGAAAPREVLRSAPVVVGGQRRALVFIPAGEAGAAPSEGIAGDRFAALMGRLPSAYDLVLVCGPPLDRGAAVAAIARRSDGVVLVAGDDREPEPWDGAIAALGGAPLLGVVLTGRDRAQGRRQSAVERSPRGNR